MHLMGYTQHIFCCEEKDVFSSEVASYLALQIRGGIRIIFFLFIDKNICCGYSLEAPRQGASNEHPQYVFVKK